MHLLDLTLDSPAANLALDEALLDQCEEGGPNVLRFWESRDYFAVVGYSNAVETEVNVTECRKQNIPIHRRCSGGGTVLQGPGCLNYSLILNFDNSGTEILLPTQPDHAPMQTIPGANCYIMRRHAQALRTALGRDVEVRGITDLAVGDVKFSGNAQRRKRHALIFHGTFLLNFDLELVSRLLAKPSKEPDYRVGREHGSFLINLNVDAACIKNALCEAWNAAEETSSLPDIKPLLTGKYTRDEWNLKF
jgi:lipoate-protein ligase A